MGLLILRSSKVRYGSAPTSYNYTGQRLDGTGLLYYGARYYDPALILTPTSSLVGGFVSSI